MKKFCFLFIFILLGWAYFQEPEKIYYETPEELYEATNIDLSDFRPISEAFLLDAPDTVGYAKIGADIAEISLGYIDGREVIYRASKNISGLRLSGYKGFCKTKTDEICVINDNHRILLIKTNDLNYSIEKRG